MKILIACEESATVRTEFEKLGHDAWSCDILPSRIPGKHFQCDVREVLGMGWDGMVFHAPCTFMANSGVRWLYNPDGSRNEWRWQEMEKAAEFFKMLLDADIPLIAGENPIPHKYALEIIGRRYDQIVQPWQFGHGETKATCLWLKGLPKLQPTNIVEGREQRIWRMPPGPNRQRERSVTYQGIAKAMASQWGSR